jgi:hypothetical protein
LGASRSGAAPQRGRRHHVVHIQSDPDDPIGPGSVERRHHERQRPHQVRRERDHQPAFDQRFTNQPEVERPQVAQPSVHELRGAAARSRSEIGLFDERHAVAAGRRIESHSGARDAAPDHRNVKPLAGQRVDRAVPSQHPRQRSRAAQVCGIVELWRSGSGERPGVG